MTRLLKPLTSLAAAAVLALAAIVPASANSVTLSAGGCVGAGGSTFAPGPQGMSYTNNGCSNGWRWIHAVFFNNVGQVLDDYNPGWTNAGDYTFFGSSSATDLIQAGHSICPASGSPCDHDYSTAP